jgi:uncharacterized membrane protein
MEMPQVPAEPGFRHRGVEVSRLETFVDAAFAFSLTLLVIFHDDLPDSAAELRDALRRIPTFIACFVLMAMFWAAHRRWSRRFGLEDAYSTIVSMAFVAVMMIYVYPLRMVISSGLSMLTGGWVPSELGRLSDDWLLDVQTLFIVYSVGFGLLSGLLWLLNAHARRLADAMRLDTRERFEVETEIGSQLIPTVAAAVSILLSVVVLATGPHRAPGIVSLPMWTYAAMGAVFPLYHAMRGRRLARMEAAAAMPGPAGPVPP